MNLHRSDQEPHSLRRALLGACTGEACSCRNIPGVDWTCRRQVYNTYHYLELSPRSLQSDCTCCGTGPSNTHVDRLRPYVSDFIEGFLKDVDAGTGIDWEAGEAYYELLTVELTVLQG